MTHPWSDLQWWNSGERQVVEEKIDDLLAAGIIVRPSKADLYKALRRTPEKATRVAIIGQDPYPSKLHANGVAFAVDDNTGSFPPTLNIIFDEYCHDLGYPRPSSGALARWTDQGVLLWNAIPSCSAGSPLSHDWDEWSYLTKEIVQRLSEKGIVFALLGAVARRFEQYIDTTKNRVIITSHPSPRGIRNSRSPFKGSRVFSTINSRLREINREPVNWRLDDVATGTSDVPRPELDRGRVLPNITGAKLGGLKAQGTSPNLYTSLSF